MTPHTLPQFPPHILHTDENERNENFRGCTYNFAHLPRIAGDANRDLFRECPGKCEIAAICLESEFRTESFKMDELVAPSNANTP